MEPVYIVGAGRAGQRGRGGAATLVAHCRLGELQNAKQRKITRPSGRTHTHTEREYSNARHPAAGGAAAGGVTRGLGGVGI